ncbi:MAG: hypothetical protein ACTSX7_20430 [Alphaproteobacteria bacterium]
MSQIATAKEQLALANRLVDEFTASVASGETMDLQHFNGTIDHACKTALELPQEDLKEVKAELMSLLERLNAAKLDLEKAQAASEEAGE